MVIKTQRLIIRQIRHTDLENLFAICGDEELMKFVGDGKPLTREQTRKWIDITLANYKEKGCGMYAVTNHSEQFIGYGGLVFSQDIQDYELIYALEKKYWGSGLGKEIAETIVRYAFETLHLPVVYASIDPMNAASEKTLLKTGFRETFRRKDEYGLETVYFII